MQAKDIPDRLVVRYALLWHCGRPTGVLQSLIEQGVPAKLALHKIVRLSGRGLLDYGVSPSCAWPTEKGLAMLSGKASEVTPPKTAGGRQ